MIKYLWTVSKPFCYSKFTFLKRGVHRWSLALELAWSTANSREYPLLKGGYLKPCWDNWWWSELQSSMIHTHKSPGGKNRTRPLVSVMYPLVMVMHPSEMVMQLLLNLSPAEQDKEDIKNRKNKSNNTNLAKNKMSYSCIPHPSPPLLHWKM